MSLTSTLVNAKDNASNLLTKANEKTNANDGNLQNAISTLISGFGTTGDTLYDKYYEGIYRIDEDATMSEVSLQIGLDVIPDVIIMRAINPPAQIRSLYEMVFLKITTSEGLGQISGQTGTLHQLYSIASKTIYQGNSNYATPLEVGTFTFAPQVYGGQNVSIIGGIDYKVIAFTYK